MSVGGVYFWGPAWPGVTWPGITPENGLVKQKPSMVVVVVVMMLLLLLLMMMMMNDTQCITHELIITVTVWNILTAISQVYVRTLCLFSEDAWRLSSSGVPFLELVTTTFVVPAQWLSSFLDTLIVLFTYLLTLPGFTGGLLTVSNTNFSNCIAVYILEPHPPVNEYS